MNPFASNFSEQIGNCYAVLLCVKWSSSRYASMRTGRTGFAEDLRQILQCQEMIDRLGRFLDRTLQKQTTEQSAQSKTVMIDAFNLWRGLLVVKGVFQTLESTLIFQTLSFGETNKLLELETVFRARGAALSQIEQAAINSGALPQEFFNNSEAANEEFGAAVTQVAAVIDLYKCASYSKAIAEKAIAGALYVVKSVAESVYVADAEGMGRNPNDFADSAAWFAKYDAFLGAFSGLFTVAYEASQASSRVSQDELALLLGKISKGQT